MRVKVYGASGSGGGRADGKTALCLCGGGITGALFEVGVLAAFDDLLGRPASTEFDVYVGSSAGASVASLTSQGIAGDRMFRALRDPTDPFFPLRREDVYQVEFGSWLRATRRILRGAASMLVPHLRRNEDRPADDLAALGDLLPAGLFRLDRYVGLLREFYSRERLARRFIDVWRDLYVVANDVDSAERVVFGAEPLRGVEIARAVAASSAIPMFFEPVRIGGRDYFDGGIGRVAHIDVAIDHGADRILVINPVVPVKNEPGKVCLPSSHGACARVCDKGLFYVGSQAWRIANRVRLHLGIKRYLADHPGVEVLLVEPSDDDTLLFTSNSMGTRARREILDWAREAGLRALEAAYTSGSAITRMDTRVAGRGDLDAIMTH